MQMARNYVFHTCDSVTSRRNKLHAVDLMEDNAITFYNLVKARVIKLE